MKLCPICATSYSADYRTCPTHGASLVEAPELTSGTMVRDRYRIEKVLGSGGMGTVYLAEDTLINEPLALKILHASPVTNPALANSGFIQQFLQVARAPRKLRQLNVVQTLEAGQAEDGSFYICTEYVDGPNLQALLEQAPEGLPLDRVFEIVRGVAGGLGAAHSEGMVHRDLKPENVLLAWDKHSETAEVVDFGIAAMYDSLRQVIQAGPPLLAAGYAAPEQWLGMAPAEMDGRTDIYALGCILYEMLTGRLPFSAQTYEGWYEQHVSATAPSLRSLRYELREYPRLDVLVQRMLAKVREDRPATVGEFLTEFDQTTVPPLERPLSAPVYGGPPPAALLKARSGLPATEPFEPAIYTMKGTKFVSPGDRDLPAPLPEMPPDSLPQARKRAGLSRNQGMLVGLVGVLMIAAVIVVAAGKFLDGTNRAHGNDSVEPPSPTPAVVPSGPTSAPRVMPKPANKPRPGSVPQPAPPAGSADAGDAGKRALAFYQNKQYAQAMPLFEQACNGGDAESCRYSGWMYQNKLGVEQNYPKAAALYLKACDGNSFEGCNDLGFLYQHNMGVHQDFPKAVELYTKACDGGNASACNNLGVMYEDKQGVAQDYARAAKLYEKACDGGNANGCSDLGDLYATGHGVAKDMEKAKGLLSKGCDMGNQWGCDRLKKLNEQQ